MRWWGTGPWCSDAGVGDILGKMILSPKGHLILSGDIFGCPYLQGRSSCTGIWQVEASDAAKHTTMLRTVPATKIDRGPNVSQWCWDWEILTWTLVVTVERKMRLEIMKVDLTGLSYLVIFRWGKISVRIIPCWSPLTTWAGRESLVLKKILVGLISGILRGQCKKSLEIVGNSWTFVHTKCLFLQWNSDIQVSFSAFLT